MPGRLPVQIAAKGVEEREHDPAHAFTFEDESNGRQPKPPEFADLPLINLIRAGEANLPEGGAARADGDGSLRRVHPGDVIRLRGMCEQLKNIDNAHGGGAALPMAVGYLRHQTPLLNGLRQADPLTAP